MLRYFIEKARERRYPWSPRPRVVVCVPSGVTSVEKRAVFEATIQAGARQAYLIEEPMNRAIAGQYPSGSTIKALTSFAALDHGIADTSSSWYCTGYWTWSGNESDAYGWHCWYKSGHVGVVVESSVEVPYVPVSEDAAALVSVISAADAAAVPEKVAAWLVGATGKGLAFAANFTFLRNEEAAALINRCALENMDKRVSLRPLGTGRDRGGDRPRGRGNRVVLPRRPPSLGTYVTGCLQGLPQARVASRRRRRHHA